MKLTETTFPMPNAQKTGITLYFQNQAYH